MIAYPLPFLLQSLSISIWPQLLQFFATLAFPSVQPQGSRRRCLGPRYVWSLVPPVSSLESLWCSTSSSTFFVRGWESLTEVNGISTPWKPTTGIEPSCWAIDNKDKLRPLEFHVPHEGKQVPLDWSANQDFLEAFVGLLDSHNARNIYSLTLYPRDRFPSRVEMTIGRCNVNLTPYQVCDLIFHNGTSANDRFRHLLSSLMMITKQHGSLRMLLSSVAAHAGAFFMARLKLTTVIG